jgi:hydrogenase-1 operon protein HyaF
MELVPTELMNAVPLLNEIKHALERWRAHGEPRTINIFNFPLTAADASWLDEVLGRGELTVEYQGMEHTFWQEAKVSGVWWGEYRNGSGNVTLRSIEIADFPTLARAQPEDIDDGIAQLAAILQAHSPAPKRTLPVLAANTD